VCDTIAHVSRADQKGRPWAIPVEFQAEPDEQMPGRALIYEGMLWMQDKPSDLPGDRYRVTCCIVNLTGVGRCAQRMDWNEAESSEVEQPEPEGDADAQDEEAGTWLLPIEWNLETLDASVLLEQVARGEAPEALLAWISLMKKGNDPGIMRRWREVADAVSDRRLKAELRLVAVYAQLTGGDREWLRNLEGFDVQESVVVKEWQDEANVKLQIKNILRVLGKKFGLVPPEVAEKVEATTSLSALEKWVDSAATADSLATFRRDAGI
jgi:hypothetical protein